MFSFKNSSKKLCERISELILEKQPRKCLNCNFAQREIESFIIERKLQRLMSMIMVSAFRQVQIYI